MSTLLIRAARSPVAGWPCGAAPAESTSVSIARVTSMRAGALLAVENFRPLYSGGLWLAVMLMPPARRPLTMAWATTGGGTGAGERVTGMPRAARIVAASRANRSDRKRVSKPTKTPLEAGPLPNRGVAIAATRRRRLANVTSSAITPRQPGVPKRITGAPVLDDGGRRLL